MTKEQIKRGYGDKEHMTKEVRNKFTYTSWILSIIVVVRHTINYKTYSCLGGELAILLGNDGEID